MLRVGVIGCGRQGRIHLEDYAAIQDASIIAVCDTDAARAIEVAEAFGATPYHNHHEMLERERLDLVSVCTIVSAHRDIVVATLRAGVAVLCEKPFALNSAEAEEMAAVARESGQLLTVGFNLRFLPTAQHLREVSARGELGVIRSLRGWCRQSTIPWWGAHYTKALSGGGVLATSMVHFLDLALWIAGFPTPAGVSGAGTSLFPARGGPGAPNGHVAARFDVEDLAAAFVRFAEGSWLALEGGWVYPGEDDYGVELVGELGHINLAPLRVMIEEHGQLVDRTPDLGEAAGLPSISAAEFLQSIRDEIFHFMRCVRGEAAPLVTLDEALAVQRLTDAIYSSVASGREVSLPANAASVPAVEQRGRQ